MNGIDFDGDLELCSFSEIDPGKLSALADNLKISSFLTNRFPHPYTIDDARAWIAAAEGDRLNPALRWRGKFVGGVGAVPQFDVNFRTAEVGYWIGEPYWGNGLATRALRLMVNRIFREYDFIRLHALVFHINTASMRVLEKNGFVREGVMRKHVVKNGTIYDGVLYARLRDE